MTTVKLLTKTADDPVRLSGMEHLRLTEIIDLIYPQAEQSEKREFARTALFAPLTVPDNIAYRRDIIRDFLADPALLDRMEVLTAGTEALRASWQEKRRAQYAGRREQQTAGAGSEIWQPTMDTLRLNCSFFLDLLERLHTLTELLAESTLYAEGLLQYKETCVRLYASYAFSASPRAAKLASADSSRFTAELLVGLNENLSVDSARLNAFSDGRRAAPQVSADAELAGLDMATLAHLFRAALERTDEETVEDCEVILKLLQDTQEQLRFYRFACDFCGALQARGIAFTFPEVTESERGVTSFIGLADPLSALQGASQQGASLHGASALPCHDILLTPEQSGIVMTGGRGVGKTALLRAVCVSQLLAQCGLPLVCRDASLCVKRAIYACFAAVDQSDAGGSLRRLEAEARAVSVMLENSLPHALFALNEIFEEVYFTDAEDALYTVFSVLAQHRMAFFATTQLPDLVTRFRDVNHVAILSMDADGNIARLNSIYSSI